MSHPRIGQFAILLAWLWAVPASAQTLNWDANPPAEAVVGYQVLIGTTSGVYNPPIAVGTVTSYPLPATNVVTYVVLKAVNSAGQISAASAEATYGPAPVPPPPCSYSVTPIGVTLDRRGGIGYVSVATTVGCAWTATSDSGWVLLTPTGGTGSASVLYQAKSNNGRPPKVSHLLIAGQAVTVTVQGK